MAISTLASLFRFGAGDPLARPDAWKGMFAALASPAFVLDADGRVAEWNAACERLTGLTREQTLGGRDHWRGFYAQRRPCLADTALTGDNSALGVGAQGALREESWFDLPGRGRRYLAVDAATVRNARGEIVAVLQTLQDLTAMKTAEEELRAAQAQAEAAVAREREEVVAILGRAVDRLAAGDLARRLDAELPGAFAPLGREFDAAVLSLAGIVREMFAAAADIAGCCSEIVNSNKNLARRTDMQAATLDESVAAARSLSDVINETALASSHSKDNIEQADREAELSRETVGRTLTSMAGIDQSSRKIGVVAGVIDEIAFQTNLLALNAGVEAARAGDAGRGFAVVAAEVRALAQRSAEAAREVKSLITEAAKAVAEGSRNMGETAQAFDRIKQQISGIDRGIFEVASRSIAQATTIKQLNVAILSMDQETQHNATMVAHATNACSALEQHSARLATLVGRFALPPEAARPISLRRRVA